ncbi:hypothetical protein Droror1_Dr00017724 [Drosera rotundifolia]
MNKRKSGNPVWKPVSTEFASLQENELAGHAAEVENVVKATAVLENQSTVVGVKAEMSVTPSPSEYIGEVVEAGGELANSMSSSVVLQDKDGPENGEQELADSITTSIQLENTDNRDAAGEAISPGSHSDSLAVGASVIRFIRAKRFPNANEPAEVHQVFKVKWWPKFQIGFVPPISMCMPPTPQQVSALDVSSSSSSSTIIDAQVLILQREKEALQRRIALLKKDMPSPMHPIYQDSQDPYDDIDDDLLNDE